MAGAVAVRGLRELSQTFNKAPKDIKRAYRDELRTIAEPVRTTAETLASSSIRKIGPKWSRMRVGVTTRLVYVAPKQRGVRTRGAAYGRDRRRRPNLGTLLAEQALEPALEQNRHRIEADFERMLDRLVDKWDHDGP